MNRRHLLRLLSGTSAAVLSGGASRGARLRAQVSPDWGTLQSRVGGRVTSVDSAEYERQRRGMVWNAVKPDRFPAAIVHVASEADVREAIRFARARQLKVAVRGGGHNWHNTAIRQGGLLIDLSTLNQVAIDAPRRIAAVQPGVTGAALIGRLSAHGLAFPVANCAQVGLSGFLLNGGLGRNYRAWGPSCASVEAIDLVDARGESIHADPDHSPELFWAARGAGPGFFGVVTRFFLRLHALPNAMMRTTASYALEDGDALAAWLTDLGPLAPPAHVSCSLANGAWRIAVIAFANTPAESREVLQPFQTEPAGLKAVTKNMNQPMPVEAVFGTAAEPASEGPRYLGDSMVSDASPRELMAMVRDLSSDAPAGSAFSFVSLERPESARDPDMAFSLTASRYVHAHGLWTEPGLDAVNRAWVERTIARLEPLAAGYYVGEANLSAAPNRARRCFSPSAWETLARLKRTVRS